MQQSPSSKIRESKLWNTKEQSGRGFNLAATSAPGHVTTALASVAPELDSTPINKLTDDKRSVVPTVQSMIMQLCAIQKFTQQLTIYSIHFEVSVG